MKKVGLKSTSTVTHHLKEKLQRVYLSKDERYFLRALMIEDDRSLDTSEFRETMKKSLRNKIIY